MKNFTIERICQLPIDFKTTNKSIFNLATESKFQDSYQNITTKDIYNYLSNHKDLITIWGIWSDDKRTTGYGLSIDNDFGIAYMNAKGETIFEKNFDSAIDACSEYILREIGSILNIDIQIDG